MHSENDNLDNPFPYPPALPGSASASLTYEPFYGLHEKPFSLSSDPRFLYKSPAHAPAFDALLAGIRRREGLIVLTGEIGTGKTTLCRSVLQHLDRRTFSAFVPDPFVSREDLLKTLLVDFGVIAISDLTRGRFNGASRSELSYSLYEFLDSSVPLQAFAVLVIDETQNLSLPLLEEIRILSELERRDKLLQVVLVGQPELRASLSLPQMRQVDQRVSVRCELAALDAIDRSETRGFLRREEETRVRHLERTENPFLKETVERHARHDLDQPAEHVGRETILVLLARLAM
jgi:general secretion pathway protein A